jgi:hypothetical protein
VERLKGKVEPLLIEVTVENLLLTAGGEGDEEQTLKVFKLHCWREEGIANHLEDGVQYRTVFI